MTLFTGEHDLISKSIKSEAPTASGMTVRIAAPWPFKIVLFSGSSAPRFRVFLFGVLLVPYSPHDHASTHLVSWSVPASQLLEPGRFVAWMLPVSHAVALGRDLLSVAARLTGTCRVDRWMAWDEASAPRSSGCTPYGPVTKARCARPSRSLESMTVTLDIKLWSYCS